MKKYTNIRHALPVILMSILVLLVVANSIVYFTRIDLTEDSIYSISEVSRTLFVEIDDQVHVSYYLSNRLRSRAAEVEQIADILYQYAAFSRGKITVEVVDPAEQNISQNIEAAGIIPRQIQVIEEDQQSVAIVYSGIVISYLDRTEAIPFIIEPNALEYEVSSAIRALIRNSERILSVLVGDERKNIAQNYPFIQNQLGQLYDIESVFPGEPISEESAALVVLGASSLNKDDLYYIDQYIVQGGKVLFAIDAVNVNVDLSFFAFPVGDIPLFELFDQYGFRIEQSLIADVNTLRVPVQRQSGGNVVIQQLVDYPYWIALLGASANSEHPITARFSGVDLFWASPIVLNEPNDPRVTTLLRTSLESWVIAEPPFNTSPEEAAALPFFKDDAQAQEHLVGILIEGEIESAFDEVPTAIQDTDIDITHRMQTSNGTIMVISDSDFPSVLSQFTQSIHNFTFFQDAVSWLVNDDDLLSIRTRANRDVRLNGATPEQKIRIGQTATFFNLVFVPLLVVLFGLIRFFLRRKQASLLLVNNTASTVEARATGNTTKSAAESAGHSSHSRDTLITDDVLAEDSEHTVRRRTSTTKNNTPTSDKNE